MCFQSGFFQVVNDLFLDGESSPVPAAPSPAKERSFMTWVGNYGTKTYIMKGKDSPPWQSVVRRLAYLQSTGDLLEDVTIIDEDRWNPKWGRLLFPGDSKVRSTRTVLVFDPYVGDGRSVCRTVETASAVAPRPAPDVVVSRPRLTTDHWIHSGSVLVRVFAEGRGDTFDPSQAADCPVPVETLRPQRVTIWGGKLHTDDWTKEKVQRLGSERWKGGACSSLLFRVNRGFAPGSPVMGHRSTRP